MIGARSPEPRTLPATLGMLIADLPALMFGKPACTFIPRNKSAVPRVWQEVAALSMEPRARAWVLIATQIQEIDMYDTFRRRIGFLLSIVILGIATGAIA